MNDERTIEGLAERFLADVPSYVWDGRSLPVPVEEIADSWAGLLVRDVENLAHAPGAPELAAGQTLSGLLLPDRGEIWVNAAEAREWPGRRRFTIAHELGHWRLHRHAGGVFCRAATVAPEPAPAPGPAKAAARPQPAARQPYPPAESEANAFAAAVLIPAALLREQYVRCERDFQRLCRRFGCSGAAMGRRLHAVI